MFTAKGVGVALDGTKRDLLVLGLERMNVANLMAGEPIHMDCERYPVIPKNLAVLIVYGDTAESILTELRKEGVITGDCEIRREKGDHRERN